MRVFLQSASMQQIREYADAGLADGVVLSPIDLADEDPSLEITDRLAEISRELALPVCVPVAAVLGGDIYREGRDLARASDSAIVQIPLLEDAVNPIRRLVADGIRVCAWTARRSLACAVRVCATHVYSGAQAFLAAKLGAMMVAVSAIDLDAHGRHGAAAVEEIRSVIDRAALECDLAVTSAPTSVAFTDYLLAGADTAFVTPAMLGSLMVHSLTDRGVDRYLSALSKRHKPRTL